MDEVRICHWCKSPQPHRRCPYCGAFRLQLQMKDKHIDDLKKRLKYREARNIELGDKTIECERLDKRLKHVNKLFGMLRERYFKQEVVIEKLQKEKIEHIGKLILLFNKNDDS